MFEPLHAAGLALALVPASPPQADWAADVDALVAAIETTHPDPYRRCDPAGWLAAAERLRDSIPDWEPHRAVLELHALAALAADGHTEAVDAPHPALRGPWLPMIFRRFEDGWFVRTGHRDHANLFGARITHFAGMPVDEVATRLARFVAADNAFGALDGVGNLMRLPAALHAAGVTSERLEAIEITATVAPGESTTVTVPAGPDSWVTPDWADADAFVDSPKPRYRRMDGNYSFEYLAEESLLYVWFDRVRDEPGESIEAFFARVFEFVASHDVERFVLDIRENKGGNLYLNLPIVHGILRSHIDRPGSLFVIIGRDTYSAAMNLAVLLEKHTHALFVGEPTGATPNHFGDTRELELPASGLRVEISELYWQNSDPRDTRPWITPDLPALLHSEDFFAHRDPALEAILAFEPDPAAHFGPHAGRWQRPNQTFDEVWPGVLVPRSR